MSEGDPNQVDANKSDSISCFQIVFILFTERSNVVICQMTFADR